MSVDVTIVVITHNSAHVVTDLLDSIPAAVGPLSVEVVLVDNASTDDTVAVVQSRRDCRVVRAPNLGYAAGFNRGASEAADPAALLVLNPDVRLEPGSVVELFAALQDPRVGIVAPKVLDRDGRLFRSLRRRPTILRAVGLNATGRPVLSEYVSEPTAYSVPHDVDWALGAALLVSRECLDRVGPWDPGYFLYSEETDFCLRAADAGFRTRFVPTAVVQHLGGESGQSATTHVMLILNRVRLYRRRHRTVPSAVYYALTILSELSWVARGHREHSTASVRALIRPRSRPPQLGCSDRLIPR